MNARKIILLDFYGDDLYSYDLIKKSFTLMNKNDNGEKYNGWIAFEKCGLFKKKSLTTGIFCLKGSIFFIFNDNYYKITKNFIFKRNTFYFLVWSIKIKINDSTEIYCKQWSKNIDLFAMDDFFYFVEHSMKENFQNIRSIEV